MFDRTEVRSGPHTLRNSPGNAQKKLGLPKVIIPEKAILVTKNPVYYFTILGKTTKKGCDENLK